MKKNRPVLRQNRKASPDDVRVEKYKGTRYWAVWINGELLAVTVYKKGAVVVKETLFREKSSV
jgi:hypothetical protein